jgi:uncharacterized protein (UPF0276 family)
LPTRAGVGLKTTHVADALAGHADVGFVEVHAENFMVAGGPAPAMLARIRERFPVSLHGVGLSLGGPARPDRDHLRRLRALIDRYEPAAFSEHLAWSGLGGRFFNDLLPVRYDDATLASVCEHVDEAQHALGQPLLLENPATYVGFEGATLGEAQFVAEVVARTGCRLLLDVTNAHVSAVNHGRDVLAELRALPLHAVGEIHLAGFGEDRDAAGARLLIDTHGAPVDEAVWALYETVVGWIGPRPTLIERDHDVPSLAVLAAEAVRADAVMARAGSTR